MPRRPPAEEAMSQHKALHKAPHKARARGSLRRKLWLGFGGLLAILATVSALSVVVLTRYSRALERVFRENYDSAVYCDAMKASLDQLNSRAQALLWDEP